MTKRGRGKAASKAKPKKKPAPTKRKKPTKKRREVIRELTWAAPGSLKRNLDGLRERMTEALWLAQEMAGEIGFSSVLDVSSPPMPKGGDADHLDRSGRARDMRNQFAWRAPWVVIGQFTWKREIGYGEVFRILDRWSQRRLESKINKDRFGRIRVNYRTERGEVEEYTMAETGPWHLMLARAKEQCDPSDTETSYPGGRTGSLASRYPESRIESVMVWLSESTSDNFMSKKR
jgi:hypothetical protein